MLAVDVHLLTDRYAAATAADRTEPEWPPHPGRLYSALVATWADAGQDPQERSALEWLEAQAPPQVWASTPGQTAHRHVVTHFVPGNDATVLSRNIHGLGVKLSEATVRVVTGAGNARAAKSAATALDELNRQAVHDSETAAQVRAVSKAQTGAALELFPERRNPQARYFPVVRPDHDHVTFVWPAAVPDRAVRDALARLVARVGRLGHSSSLVMVGLADTAPEPDGRGTYLPGAPSHGRGDSWALRVPAQGLLVELERSFARHQGREPRALPSMTISYHLADDQRPATTRPQTAGRWWVFDLPPSCHVRITRAVDVTRALRAAIMSHATDPLPPALTGHGGPAGLRHVQWLALPMIGSAHSDGHISALVIAAPPRLADHDVEVIEDGVAAFIRSGGRLRWPGGSAVLASARESLSSRFDPRSPRRRSAERGFWARRSTVWRTATPIALDRFPRAARSATARKAQGLDVEVTQIVSRACRDVGLPEPRLVQIVGGSPLVGVPPVRPGRGAGGGPARFGFFRSASGQVRYSVHAQVVFADPVAGPIVLGAGRHFGYGLLFPVNDDETHVPGTTDGVTHVG